MKTDPFTNELSRNIWESKYRYCEGPTVVDQTICDTWRRVAKAIAAAEGQHSTEWEEKFYRLLEDFRFLPGGRILAGAGTERRVTLFNCFVMGIIQDSLDSIFEGLREGALTMQQGGGVGYDFSTLRPRGSPAFHVGTQSSGPVSFMGIWDVMCDTLLSTGSRRGAMMATLRCDHPDIEEFVEAKRDPRALRNFNLSVLVSDDFMEAVKQDSEWPLVFPVLDQNDSSADLERQWPGHESMVRCRIYRRIRARDLWERIMRAAYDVAEPGVLFIDRINAENNLHYREYITATNPCGEIPLPPYGACDLGSVNLTYFVRDPFSDHASFDWKAFEETVQLGVRFLDNVITVSKFPLEALRQQATETRRIGLGVTGIADTLALLGLRYGDAPSLEFAKKLFAKLRDSAYRCSCALAREKGAFPALDINQYLNGCYAKRLPEAVREEIARTGIRNSHLLAIAPAGTISVLANNVSSGIEPIFDLQYTRKFRRDNGCYSSLSVTDYAWSKWKKSGQVDKPPYFVTAREIEPDAQLSLQAAVQPFIDNAISKTVYVRKDYPYEEFVSLYEKAYLLGLKGCTTFRPNPTRGEILSSGEEQPESVHCCAIDREGA
ncbi:MAG: hypothetical protein Kow006_08390 [Gammaproteobacteria bacterium]